MGTNHCYRGTMSKQAYPEMATLAAVSPSTVHRGYVECEVTLKAPATTSEISIHKSNNILWTPTESLRRVGHFTDVSFELDLTFVANSI